jgi:hypothetical protein
LILHASPESAAGCGLSWLETGDKIRIDLGAGRCDALVPGEEIERRKREKDAPSISKSRTPWQELYRASVSQLDGGGVLESAQKPHATTTEAETERTPSAKTSGPPLDPQKNLHALLILTWAKARSRKGLRGKRTASSDHRRCPVEGSAGIAAQR